MNKMTQWIWTPQIDIEDLIATFPYHQKSRARQCQNWCTSQKGQDLFVLPELNFKRGGFFLDVGASNGFDFSNTHVFEKMFGWKGILVEPARSWHEQLRNNRSAIIDTRCLWKESNLTVNFREVTDRREFSTIGEFLYADAELHGDIRKVGIDYTVQTISLNDLLEQYQAPTYIDYLSIDTEGSEFDILNSFDFDKYHISVITCEHNYNVVQREKIFELLTYHDYTRKLEHISDFDDWYVRKF